MPTTAELAQLQYQVCQLISDLYRFTAVTTGAAGTHNIAVHTIQTESCIAGESEMVSASRAIVWVILVLI
jgi:hypothetical protein